MFSSDSNDLFAVNFLINFERSGISLHLRKCEMRVLCRYFSFRAESAKLRCYLAAENCPVDGDEEDDHPTSLLGNFREQVCIVKVHNIHELRDITIRA